MATSACRPPSARLPPPKLVGLALATAEHTDEVRGHAGRRTSTSPGLGEADEIFEMQEVTIEAAYGQVVAGNFSVYPDADAAAFEALATPTRGP